MPSIHHVLLNLDVTRRAASRAIAAAWLALVPMIVHAQTLTNADVAPEHVIAATSKTGHLWFVTPRRGDPAAKGFVICHSGPESSIHYRPLAQVVSRPAAIAAFGDRLWLVLESNDDRGAARREVFTIRARRDAMFERYVAEPADRLELIAPLPPDGRLAAFTSAPGVSGPAALIANDDGSVRLLQLQSGGWVSVDVPVEVDAKRRLMLGEATGHGGDRVTLIEEIPGEPGRLIVYERDASNDWRSVEASLGSASVRVAAATPAAGQTALVLRNGVNRESEGVSQSVIAVKYLRGDRMLPLMELDEPESPWTVLSRGGGLIILEIPADQPPVIRTIDAISGAVGERIALSVQPIAVGRVWMLAIVVAAAAAAALLGYIVLRKRGTKPASAPKGD